MLNEIIILVFGILGILLTLMSIVFKLLLWKEERFTLMLPLKNNDMSIINRLCNLRDILDFCGMYKKSTVVLINYGASDYFCNKITADFGGNFVKILSPDQISKELHT